MIPSRTWFPSSWSDRADWYDNFSTQFTIIAVSLGFTAIDAANVDKDSQQMAFFAELTVQLDAYGSAARGYRDVLTMGNDGDPTPPFPPNPTFAPPFAIDTGMFERLDNLVKRIKLAAGYTVPTGELLGIEPPTTTAVPPGGVTPTIKVFPAQTGYMFSIVVSNREDADAWIVQIRPAGGGDWTNAGTFTGKSADVEVTPPEGAVPLQIDIRVRLRKGNEDYGNLSQTATITVNP